MEQIKDPLFQALFDHFADACVLLGVNRPDYTVIAVNKQFKRVSKTDERTITGKRIEELVKPYHNFSQDISLFQDTFEKAVQRRAPVKMHNRYELALNNAGNAGHTWWMAEVVPVVAADQPVQYLIATFKQTHKTATGTLTSYGTEILREEYEATREELAASNEELTTLNEELKYSQESLETLNDELEDRVEKRTTQLTSSRAETLAERDRLKRFLMEAPAGVCVLDGEDLVFELINSNYQALFPGRSLLGRPVREAIPEIKGAPIEAILEDVYRNGKTFEGKELLIPLAYSADSPVEDRYFNFTYQPRYDANGGIDGIMVFVYEVTDLVKSRLAVQQREDSLNTLVMSARYALMILRGRDLVVEVANRQIADLWGKDLSNIRGRQLLEILPELEDQPYPALLRRIFDTGESYGQEEELLYIDTPQGQEKKYISFYYDPIVDQSGKVSGIVVAANDITDFVRSRQMLQESNEEQQTLNEELSAINEEVTSANEELATTNEELSETQVTLQNTIDRLALSEGRFRELIKQAPVAIAVFKGEELIVEMANPVMLQLLNRGSELISKPVLHTLPEFQNHPIIDVIKGVYRSGQTQYGTELPVALNGKTRYFNYTYTPLLDGDKITGVIEVAVEVTEQVEARRKLEESTLDLRALVMTAKYALMILRGSDWMIEIANQPLADLWNKPLDKIVGLTLLEVLPELVGQPFPMLLRQVYDTGLGYGQEEEVFYLDSPDGIQTKYVSFHYDPLFDSYNRVCGIVVAAHDITEIVQSRKNLEESYDKQQSLNEELVATNEELTAANEELITINDELAETQLNLRKTIFDLAMSEARFRNLVKDAPVAIGLLAGRDLVIESANNFILNLWGKGAEIVGMPLAEAMPELKGQPFLEILDTVFTSGETFYGNEARADLMQPNGQLREGYFNFIYQPVGDESGKTTLIIVVANDVTEQVLSRRELQRAEEMLRFSVEAANVGTWFMDMRTRSFIASTRMKELFGFQPDEEMTFEDTLAQIPGEYAEKVRNSINEAMNTGGRYVMEHPVTGLHDHLTRWVRASGRFENDEISGAVAHFSGIILDITEQKQDEMRKNDFIGMVSHELKTPLTSLTAYVQVLQAKARKSEDNFTADALARVNQQVRKMSALINGFLNVSRLESGKIYLVKQLFDLDQLVEDTIEENNLMISTHTITLVPCNKITVNADRDKIGSVISNLLSNAVKYSPRGKAIEVKCEVKEDMAIVSVHDEGMGIKLQDMDKLFDRFYRVESKHTKHISGFGIGLYLCAEIIRRHNGRIWAESEVGVGSTFYFSLPLE